MAEIVQMFLFLYKSKYRRKGDHQWRRRSRRDADGDDRVAIATSNRQRQRWRCNGHSTDGAVARNVPWAPFLLWAALVCWVVHVSAVAASTFPTLDGSLCDACIYGNCINGTCVCHDGWQGANCEFCGGKVRLSERSGYIHDGFGNYSADVKCSWLIEGPLNTKIRMHVEQFATECGWDHLYIYDGDSVEAPLLAVFSGLMHKEGYHIRRVPEVIARSGSALLHFYSDVAYNMSGFNITYKINACPSRYSHMDCSGHGVCIEGTCTCDAMWTGEACDVQVCPNNCSFHHGQGECDRESHHCRCFHGYKGADCSQKGDRGFWESITYKDLPPDGSASHCSIIWKDSLYVVGGESFHRAKMIYVYDYNGNVWETPHVQGRVPLPRYAHSCVLFGDKIFMYGGVVHNSTVTNEIWAFDVSSKVWENVTVHDDCHNRTICGPLKVAGHTATLVQSHGKKEKMVVIFGYSPRYGYLNTVQEYYLGTREWQIAQTTGFPVKGGYGHSSAYDPLTNLIYVYGGYVSESQSSQVLSSMLYSYHPNFCEWRLLTSAPSARFFHTAVFVSGGLMLVFGGNIHNDTQQSHGARCYSADTLGYDVTCDTWHHYSMPRDMSDLPRYGHSATVFEKSMYIYGGFDGQMLSDMLRYTPGNCEHLTTQNQCLNARIGVKCVWHKRDSRCVQITKLPQHVLNHMEYNEDDSIYMKCLDDTPPRGMTSHEELCKLFTDCVACVQTSYNCVWCGKSCLHEKCRDNPSSLGSRPIVRLLECDANTGVECMQLHTCHACSSNSRCIWSWSNGPDRCKPQSKIRDREMNGILNGTIQAQRLILDPCRHPCVEYTSCRNCTESDCIWCHNEAKCVDKNAYPASFPYGQCREWTTIDVRCRATESGREWCSFYSSCASCRADPGCGWCDDGSGTGKGLCLPGGARGPSSKSLDKCSFDHWYFTQCPTCQCNGHSKCLPNSSVCIQPCGNLTYGPHCDKCIPGYYGSPLNGATCQPCSCNNQGTQCTSETGKCFCTTKGIIGDHCERCDVSGLYQGDPTNKGSCFYDLAIDYQFTFNLSKKEDRHYRAINFKNAPPKPDVDAEFSITCSVLAKMNVTIKKVNSPEKALLLGANCTTIMYKHRFSKADYNFGNEDNNTLTTFYVYVYDFQPPLWIQISFSQYSKLNLQQFFITFCTDYMPPHRCFLALLLVAAILWKIKQKYDMYRRRQRLFLEMEQMASRAFSSVLVEIERRDVDGWDAEHGDADFTDCHNKIKDAPSPIALEPCCGNRAAVLTLLVRLPTGGEPYTPAGQSAGLAVASALVTLGSPRRPSQELVMKEPKKTRKCASQHPDSTCI
ncbi:attractin-like protein 1 isoform X2 [Linepithema humile]|uniref:attractin-like protein 1 isoform X2 n=1 Tax=Linepithema humile TaxID=83485 RepID=UPI0006234E46|nr:PREDICTED: attractin-like protein 1 isoform X2 [Linepithema humile]